MSPMLWLMLSMVFLMLTLTIPTLFKYQPFLMLPLLATACILLMRQSLLSQRNADP